MIDEKDCITQLENKDCQNKEEAICYNLDNEPILSDKVFTPDQHYKFIVHLFQNDCMIYSSLEK